jgi:hypothetical protein
MKTKKFEKKLVLKKKTIANLNNGQLGQVKGGLLPTRTDCLTCVDCPTDTCETCPATCNTCAAYCTEYYTCPGKCTVMGTCLPECPVIPTS